MTHLIPKYHKDKDGNKIDPTFNNRMYAKKAYKAYLQGKTWFLYKGHPYMVPKMPKQALDDYLESVTLEELENFNPLENTEENEQ